MGNQEVGLTGERPDAPDLARAGLLRGLVLSHVVGALHDGVAVVDAAGRVLDANNAFTALVPLDRRDADHDQRAGHPRAPRRAGRHRRLRHGYSSLTHLVDVPASYVKIDRSFVGRMTGSDASTANVSAVVSLCRALHIDVVAEGIEEEDQRTMISRLGCSYGKGYLLGRPGRIDLTAHERAGNPADRRRGAAARGGSATGRCA